MISPQIFLPNLSTDGQENASFGAKNTNPHTTISKPAHGYGVTFYLMNSLLVNDHEALLALGLQRRSRQSGSQRHLKMGFLSGISHISRSNHTQGFLVGLGLEMQLIRPLVK